MDLGYRCSLLYKAFWGEEEEKNPCSRCLFEENGEMCDECVISQRIQKKEERKQTKEEFEAELFKAHGRAIEKFTEMRLRVEFKTAHEMFTYAKISYRKKRGMIRESIFIKCPKCGKVGKLRRNRRHYYIYHKYQSCHIGTCSEFYDFVDKIYRMYRSRSSLTEEKRKGVVVGNEVG